LPTTRTAEKEMRAAERRQARNKSFRSRTKSSVAKAVGTVASGNLELAQMDVKTAVSALDKEAERGKSHRNNAARRKARLMKKLNQALATTKETAVKPKRRTTRKAAKTTKTE
jgi:small subunit ribosomal protein S20